MKKTIAYLTMFVSIGIFLASCSSNESYSDHLKREKDGINRLIDKKGIKLIYNYPSNGVFGANEYFHYKEGTLEFYLHVIDSGKGPAPIPKKAPYAGSDIYIRFEGLNSLTGISKKELHNYRYVNRSNTDDPYPTVLTYGDTPSYPSYSYFVSPAVMKVLDWVRNGAIVSLIVPFKSGSGSDHQGTFYETFYYDKIYYSYEYQ